MMRGFSFLGGLCLLCSLDSHKPLIAPLCDFTKTNMQKYCTNKTRRTYESHSSERSCISSLQLSPSQPHRLLCELRTEETGMRLGNM